MIYGKFLNYYTRYIVTSSIIGGIYNNYENYDKMYYTSILRKNRIARNDDSTRKFEFTDEQYNFLDKVDITLDGLYGGAIFGITSPFAIPVFLYKYKFN
jgi:hypothetical protein